jgi:4-diphosphocytidyl-2-C-methyl-D-erythritol kinase
VGSSPGVALGSEGHVSDCRPEGQSALEVLGRRDDGYHEIRSVLQTLSLHDMVTLSPAEHLELRRTGIEVEQTPIEADLAYRAAEALRQAAGKTELCALIELEGDRRDDRGGSSDAAAVLRAWTGYGA